MPEDHYRHHQGETPDSVQFPQVNDQFPARKIFEEFLGQPRPTDRISQRGVEATERPAEQQIVDVLLRNDDFGYGTKRDKVSNLLKSYVDRGPEALQQIADKINAELKKRGSHLSLSATHNIEESYEVYQRDAGNLAIYYHPVHVHVKEPVGNLTLKNRFGETEDSLRVAGTATGRESVRGMHRVLTPTHPVLPELTIPYKDLLPLLNPPGILPEVRRVVPK